MAGPALHNVLLESGTNELEVLVFSVDGQPYGVNVAKVREVIEPVPITNLPQTHKAVLGVFRLRDDVMPLVDLPRCLSRREKTDPATGKVIVMEFNDVRVGFQVDSVKYIHRVSASKLEATPEVEGVRDAPITFILQLDGELVLMVDFERIVFDIAGVDFFGSQVTDDGRAAERAGVRILMAEDSHTMRDIIGKNLVQAGYKNITQCTDGQEAWETLEQHLSDDGTIDFDVVLTDIEMPRMDGLRLTRQIKEHANLKLLPVVVFSSVISKDNEKKCKAVGANAQITKPNLGLLVNLIDDFALGNTKPA